MGEYVDFPSNGEQARGYLARPPAGRGPGLVVVQEWWGLDSSLKVMVDRLAEGGFVALAPDLFRGELASHDEMDKAARLMQSLPPDRAARDMSGSVDYLDGHEAVNGKGIGVVGFCMGGMLALHLAALRPDKVSAVVTFYGFPQGDQEPDWSRMRAAVRGHMAERDQHFPPEAARQLEAKLKAMGKDVEFTFHPAGHAFMNPENALGTSDPELAARIWPGVLAFLHERLDA
jgi:carboxymethylenebutenolidase